LPARSFPCNFLTRQIIPFAIFKKKKNLQNYRKQVTTFMLGRFHLEIGMIVVYATVAFAFGSLKIKKNRKIENWERVD